MADSDNEHESRADKRKKKRSKSLRVEMSVLMETTDRTAPVVGYFSSGYNPCDHKDPPEVRVFRNKNHPSSRLDLVVKPKGSNVEFVGKSYEGEAAAPQVCQYALGVLDKDTQTLKVVPIAANKIFRLEPRVMKSSSAEEPTRSEQDHSAAKQWPRAADTAMIYGTRKQKNLAKKFRQLREQINDPTARGDLEGEMLDAEDNKEVHKDTNETAGPNIPPHDLSAVTPEKAYLLDEIILKAEREHLFDILELLHSDVGDKPTFSEENFYPSFVINRIPNLKQIQDEDEKQQHAFILSYIRHLVNFWKLAASSRRSKSRDNVYGDAVHKYKIPRVVYQKFAKLFLDPASNVLSTERKELLIGYILVLTLFADSFCSNPSDIAKDLGMTLPELRLYFMQLGCKVSRDSWGKYSWTLSVPLEFVALKSRKRPRK